MTELPGENDHMVLARALRVDHAGEYGAVRIYEGQLAVLRASRRTKSAARIVARMKQAEVAHLANFDALLAKHRVRPTLLQPLWHVAGFALGAATALIGEKAAMACTSAIEEVIDAHYADQRQRLELIDPDIANLVEEFRREEVEHRNTAIAQGAGEAPLYPMLNAAIKMGCRLAIAASERI